MFSLCDAGCKSRRVEGQQCLRLCMCGPWEPVQEIWPGDVDSTCVPPQFNDPRLDTFSGLFDASI